MLWAMLALVCAISVCGLAYGQIDNQTRFFIVTELGNTFEISGPPPDRLPGFDSAPYLNTHRIDTAYSLSAGGAPGVPPIAQFGQAGSVIPLPEHDPRRTSMRMMLVTDWGRPADSRYLFTPFPVGELRMDGTMPYLGPGVANHAAVDILEWCNVNGTGISCVDNRSGRDMGTASSSDHGHVLDLPPVGRTIIHMADVASDLNVTARNLEVFFTCPDCLAQARAYYGVGNAPFMERGFQHPNTLQSGSPPVVFGAGTLRGLAWGSVADPNGITYWQDGGPCTPSLSISGSSIQGTCPTGPIQAGTVQALVWQALTPGWNSVITSSDAFVIVMDPGNGAKLQIRNGTEQCCSGFSGGVVNRAGSAAVIHDTDRHLLIIPNGGEIPADHPALQEMHRIRWEAREGVSGTPRWLAHSESGDPVYHGMLYDGTGTWPPYMVRPVDAAEIRLKSQNTDILDHLKWGNYTTADLNEVVRIGDRHHGGVDSEIYDMRNDIWMRADAGTFKLWDGTEVERAYIIPWMNVQKNPVWEKYGVHLPEDKALIVDVYATIPVVKPTNLHDTYLSSIPCGHPDMDDVRELKQAVFVAAATREYDEHLINFLAYADDDGEVNDNLMLQHIYLASRTYLDYLDGTYLDGDEVHVPVLPNRPYLCTTISPNTLESQFMVYGLPFTSSYVSLGGTEGTAVSANLTDTTKPAIYERTVGVQSPRDGIVSLDVTASIGAAVSAFGTGDANPGRTISTGQWLNGTVSVKAELCVQEDLCKKDERHYIPLTEFDIDLHNIVEETYLLDGDRCYGRFVTVPDDSEYVVKTVTVPASLGEHIPVTVRLTTAKGAAVSTGPFTYPSSPLLVPDNTVTSETVTVAEPGTVDTASLTITWLNADGYDSIGVYGGGAWTGGTTVSIMTPGGVSHALPAHTDNTGVTTTHTFDLNLLAGETMNGQWTIIFDNLGDIPGRSTDRRDNWITSMELEFTRADGLSVGDICDRTEMESIIVQYILRTFVIDVR